MTTERPDFYAILGMEPSATQVEISRAYRALLRRYHPDTRSSPDEPHRAASDAALQHVIAAYAVLHDPLRRAEYDRTATSRAQPTRHRRQQANDLYGRYGVPPIVAGPVRWHPSP